jgi:hypothetical protein
MVVSAILAQTGSYGLPRRWCSSNDGKGAVIASEARQSIPITDAAMKTASTKGQ